jgi:hypothetical protein
MPFTAFSVLNAPLPPPLGGRSTLGWSTVMFCNDGKLIPDDLLLPGNHSTNTTTIVALHEYS